MTFSSAPLPTSSALADDFAQTVWEVAVAGLFVLRPCYGEPAGSIQDFAYVHLNPVAQRQLGLPASPAESLLAGHPAARETGLFAFYCAAFASGQTERTQIAYSPAELAGAGYLVARRSGEHLVVSCPDYPELPLVSAAEAQLREREELAARNEELHARNEHYRMANTALLADQQQLRRLHVAQQDLLEQILRQVPVAIATLSGPEHRFSFANARYQYLVGNRVVLGQPVAVALPEVVEQGVIELLDRVYQTGESFIGREIIIMLEQPPGPPHHYTYDLTYLALRDGQGQVKGILVLAVEVTEQVRARRHTATLQAELLAVAQRQAQERQNLYQVFEQTPTAIVLLREPDHRIEYLNPAFTELFSSAAAANINPKGHPLARMYPQLQQAGLARLLDRVYATGEPQVVLEMPLAELQPGSPRYVTFAFQAYREQGRLVGIAAFIYDTTEQVLARQQVQHLNQELALTNAELQTANTHLGRTNTDLGTFVYTASHDLKAPINNIEGLLTVLRDMLPAAVQQDQATAHVLGLLDTTVQRFLATITQLTDLSRLQRDYDEPAAELALAPVVASVLADLAPVIAEAGAAVEVAVPAELQLSFAPSSLRSIVYNLLSNAVKYRDPARPAQVQVQAEQQPGAVVLSVRDNGLGLTASQQQQLFQVFQRLHTHVEGTGVGLYMIKRLIDNAGATIAVTSVPGVGTAFTVTFSA